MSPYQSGWKTQVLLCGSIPLPFQPRSLPYQDCACESYPRWFPPLCGQCCSCAWKQRENLISFCKMRAFKSRPIAIASEHTLLSGTAYSLSASMVNNTRPPPAIDGALAARQWVAVPCISSPAFRKKGKTTSVPVAYVALMLCNVTRVFSRMSISIAVAGYWCACVILSCIAAHR